MEFDKWIRSETAEQSSIQESAAALITPVPDLQCTIVPQAKQQDSGSQSPARQRQVIEPASFSAKYVSVQVDGNGAPHRLWTAPQDNGKTDLEVRCFHTGAKVLSFGGLKAGCHVTAVAHAAIAADAGFDVSAYKDFTWVGQNDGSIRLISTGSTFEHGLNTPNNNGEIHVVFELPKVHAGAITCFALSPHRQRDEGLANSRQAAPLQASSLDSRRRYNNTFCVGSLDSFVSVWSLSTVYVETEKTKNGDVKEAPRRTASSAQPHILGKQEVQSSGTSRDRTLIVSHDPFDESEVSRVFSRCIVVETARPLVRLKHAVAGVRTISWVTPVCVNSNALPVHWAQNYDLQQLKRHETPLSKFHVEVDEEDDKLDDPERERLSRRKQFIRDESSDIKENAPVHDKFEDLSSAKGFMSIDMLITGDEEGRVVLWDLQHELKCVSPAISSPAPVTRVAPSSWGTTRELPPAPKGSFAARTSSMQVDFPFGNSVVAISAVLPQTIAVKQTPHDREELAGGTTGVGSPSAVARVECLRSLFDALDILVALADGSVQLVSCHVKSSTSDDDDSSLTVPYARRPAGFSATFRVGEEAIVNGGFSHNSFTVFFSHRERFVSPRKPIATACPIPSLNGLWLATTGSDHHFFNASTFNPSRFSSPTTGTSAVTAVSNPSASRLLFVTKGADGLEFHTFCDVPEFADHITFDGEIAAGKRTTDVQAFRVQRAEEKRQAKLEAKEWRRKLRETTRRMRELQGVLSDKRDRANVYINRLRRNVPRKKWIRRLQFDEVIFAARNERVENELSEEKKSCDHAQRLWVRVQRQTSEAVEILNTAALQLLRRDAWKRWTRGVRANRQYSKASAVLAQENSTLRHVFRRWIRLHHSNKSNQRQRTIFIAAKRTLESASALNRVAQAIDGANEQKLLWHALEAKAMASTRVKKLAEQTNVGLVSGFFSAWRDKVQRRLEVARQENDAHLQRTAEACTGAQRKALSLVRLEEQEDAAHRDRLKLEVDEVIAQNDDVASSFRSTVLAHQIFFPSLPIEVEVELRPVAEPKSEESPESKPQDAAAEPKAQEAAAEPKAQEAAAEPKAQEAAAEPKAQEAAAEPKAQEAAKPEPTLFALAEPLETFGHLRQHQKDVAEMKKSAMDVLHKEGIEMRAETARLEDNIREVTEPNIIERTRKSVVEPLLLNGSLDAAIYAEEALPVQECESFDAGVSKLSQHVMALRDLLGHESLEEIEQSVRAEIENQETLTFAQFEGKAKNSASWSVFIEVLSSATVMQEAIKFTSPPSFEAVAASEKLSPSWWDWPELVATNASKPRSSEEASCESWINNDLATAVDSGCFTLKKYENSVLARILILDNAIANPEEGNRAIIEKIAQTREELDASSKKFDAAAHEEEANINRDRDAAIALQAKRLQDVADDKANLEQAMNAAEIAFTSSQADADQDKVNELKRAYLEKSEQYENRQAEWVQQENLAKSQFDDSNAVIEQRTRTMLDNMANEDKRRVAVQEEIRQLEASATDTSRFQREKEELSTVLDQVRSVEEQRKQVQKRLTDVLRKGFVKATPAAEVTCTHEDDIAVAERIWARRVLRAPISAETRLQVAKSVVSVGQLVDALILLRSTAILDAHHRVVESGSSRTPQPEETPVPTSSFGTNATPMVRTETEAPGASFGGHSTTFEVPDAVRSLLHELLLQARSVHRVAAVSA